MLPVSIWSLISLCATNMIQFKSLWRSTDSLKIKYSPTQFFDAQKILMLFNNQLLFKNFIIHFNYDPSDDKKKNVASLKKSGKYGILFKTLHDDKVYMMKFIVETEGLNIITRAQKNNIESFRLLESLIDTFLSIIR